jgi:hypothetical protein
MRFLSLSRPWPWALFDFIADKGIENRSWAPPIDLIGHQIAIQSAQSWDDDAMGYFLKLGLDHFPHRKDLYPSGVIAGVATIDRVVTSARTLGAQARWFFGEYGWVLTHRIALPTPVPCKGAQGLRTLPPDIATAVALQLDQLSRERNN